MEKYYTLIETCVEAEDKNTVIEKTENVLRGKPQGVEYEASAILNADTVHKAYLQYLSRWIFDHYEDEFKGCSPACFDEWLDNEYEEDEEDVEYDVALGCNEDDYVLASNGNIKIKKSLVYESFCKVGKELRIWFVDEDDPLHTYRVVEVTDDEVIAEFID